MDRSPRKGAGAPPPAAIILTQAAPSHRLVALDLARTLALAAMIAFHFRFDLVLYGMADPSLTQTTFFIWHARLVAGAFLTLAGVSLWLAHGQGLRWRAFWRRLARLIGAAALVSLVTYYAVPQAWVFFGILHSIALGSLLALPFLRLPAGVTLVAGLAVIGAAQVLPELLAWNHPGLRWLGLQTLGTATVDLEPLFPWFGLMLIGLGLGRLWAPHRLRPAPPPGRLLTALAWPGRHSLMIYLVHQPVLMALIWTWSNLP